MIIKLINDSKAKKKKNVLEVFKTTSVIYLFFKVLNKHMIKFKYNFIEV
jgi:hypothetical protein